MKAKWIRKIVSGLSFTSALFVFQACYGTPQDFGLDVLIEGQVKSKSTGLPVPGIKVLVENNAQFELTDDDGCFSFYTEVSDSLFLKVFDADSAQKGHFASFDTVLSNLSEKVYLTFLLEEAKVK